jgi:hypothetical protein
MKLLKVSLLLLGVFLMTACERRPPATTDPEGNSTGPVVMTIWTTAEKQFFDSLANEFYESAGSAAPF